MIIPVLFKEIFKIISKGLILIEYDEIIEKADRFINLMSFILFIIKSKDL